MRRFIVPLTLVQIACGRVGFDTVADAGGNAGSLEWTLAQVVERGSSAQASLAPTAMGSLLVVGITIADISDAIVQITDDRGNAYAGIPTARSTNIGGIEIWFAENIAQDTSLITVATASSNKPTAIVVWEVANMRRANAFDTALAASMQPLSSVARTPTISTAASGDFVVAVAKVELQVSSVVATSGFVADSSLGADGWAHLADPQAPPGIYQAAWNTNAGTFCASIAAFHVGP